MSTDVAALYYIQAITAVILLLAANRSDAGRRRRRSAMALAERHLNRVALRHSPLGVANAARARSNHSFPRGRQHPGNAFSGKRRVPMDVGLFQRTVQTGTSLRRRH